MRKEHNRRKGERIVYASVATAAGEPSLLTKPYNRMVRFTTFPLLTVLCVIFSIFCTVSNESCDSDWSSYILNTPVFLS